MQLCLTWQKAKDRQRALTRSLPPPAACSSSNPFRTRPPQRHHLLSVQVPVYGLEYHTCQSHSGESEGELLENPLCLASPSVGNACSIFRAFSALSQSELECFGPRRWLENFAA